VTAPEKLSIDTPEQVTLDFPLAGVGSFLALAVDTLLQIATAMVVILGALALWRTLDFAGASAGPWTAALVVLVLFFVYYGYFAAFEAAWRGQTPGKRLIGLRVISTSGRPIHVDEALIRNLLRIVDQLPAIYGVGILSVLVTTRNQRLGDLAAGTVVVHEYAVEEQAASDETRSSARPFGLRLADEEAMLIEAFLKRRRELDVFVRERRASEIASHMRRRLAIDVSGISDEALLEALIAEHRTTGRYR
jgi:uncharacterized RDD family membrane protein YckC